MKIFLASFVLILFSGLCTSCANVKTQKEHESPLADKLREINTLAVKVCGEGKIKSVAIDGFVCL